MIPILYEKNETAFNSNGLGRLRDIISMIVTEERNGVYEADFQYPTNGAHFDEIQVGRIIAVTHDDTGDVQPFDIVSYKRDIEGIVSFHAVHISYRQSFLTVTGTNINTLADAFTLLKTSTPTNPFNYWTDKTNTGYMAAADGVPRSVRQLLGGVEGSILDAYRGEYEFDKWTVKLHANRGKLRDFAIRYGVNMVNFDEEYDSSETYSSCIPFYKNGDTILVGSKQVSGQTPPSGREQCIPLDVSEKFENPPATTAEVEAEGLAEMNAQDPTNPVQSLTVDFVRLQELENINGYENLYKCQLCDTIKVYFPGSQTSKQYKIVKTVWNALTNRYDEMELGQLSTSLSEALGLSNDLDRSGGGGGSISLLDYFETEDVPVNWTATGNANSSSTKSPYTATHDSTNYAVLGIVGWELSGTGIASARVLKSCIDGNGDLYVYVHNDNSSNRSWTMTFRVLYLKK